MTSPLLRRDLFFYPLLFGAWAMTLLLRFGDHRYFDSPLSSAGFEKTQGGISKLSLLRNSIAELQKNLVEEKDAAEKPHILQNIGCAYYDLYRELNDRTYIDSALTYVQRSIEELPRVARFHYNFGRIFTEIGDQRRALQQYELALQYDPSHILALSNAGTCSYFAFTLRENAANYFGRALVIDSMMPMCHLVLGLIGLDEKDYAAARNDFERELSADQAALIKRRYPLSVDNIRYAASLAAYNLMLLYSTKFPDRPKASKYYEEYLTYETDPVKKGDASKEMKKYWGGK